MSLLVRPAYVTVTSRVRMSKTLNHHTSGAAVGHALITGSCSREHYYMVEFRHSIVATVSSEPQSTRHAGRSWVFPTADASSVTIALGQLLVRWNYFLLPHFYILLEETPCTLREPTFPNLTCDFPLSRLLLSAHRTLLPPHITDPHHHPGST